MCVTEVKSPMPSLLAEFIKCLLSKHKDHVQIPIIHIKSQALTLTMGVVRTLSAIPRISWNSQPALLTEKIVTIVDSLSMKTDSQAMTLCIPPWDTRRYYRVIKKYI